MFSSTMQRLSLSTGLGALLVALALASPQPALAQSRTPTASELDAFRSLTPEQQRAVLEQLQKSGRGSTGT